MFIKVAAGYAKVQIRNWKIKRMATPPETFPF